FQQRIEAGGLVAAHWDGSGASETAIKEATKATIRCIPLNQKPEAGSCIYSGQPSQGRVLFAKAY
ncbi:MAG: proline--tRNA ligase, partial [Bacteroidota bacterium]